VGYNTLPHYDIIYTSDRVLINICMKVDISVGTLEDWASRDEPVNCNLKLNISGLVICVAMEFRFASHRLQNESKLMLQNDYVMLVTYTLHKIKHKFDVIFIY
jgi:hypothetical protein